jgi:hypothetical protein
MWGRGPGRIGGVFALTFLAVLSTAAALSAQPAATRNATTRDCKPIPRGVKCRPGHGEHKPGGRNGSTSHAGWPGFTGIEWQVISNSNNGETRTATKWNDELLGRNGSDTLSGGPGNDVIWGDSNAALNGPAQHDVLSGGDGADWIYGSHGTNTITGGPGNDRILAAFGHGTIDCGPGNDTVAARHGHYKLKNCEHRVHKIN